MNLCVILSQCRVKYITLQSNINVITTGNKFFINLQKITGLKTGLKTIVRQYIETIVVYAYA